MLRRARHADIATSEGGRGGMGKGLHAAPANTATFRTDALSIDLTPDALKALHGLQAEAWLPTAEELV